MNLAFLAFALIAQQTPVPHPPTGRYAVYNLDAQGNATFAYDLEVLTVSTTTKPGKYEIRMGKAAITEHPERQGGYRYDPKAQRIDWLSGPIGKADAYKRGLKNPNAGKVSVNRNRWTIILNERTKALSVSKS